MLISVIKRIVLLLFIAATGSAQAAISFVASSSNTSSNTNSLTINLPAGTAVNDVMVAQVTRRGGPPETYAAPTGWVQIDTDLHLPLGGVGGNTHKHRAYYKVVTAADLVAGNATWSFADNRNNVGGISTYSGVDTANPIHMSSENGQQTNGSTIDALGVTTTVDGAMLIAFYGINNNLTYTGPTGYTQRYEQPSGSNDIEVMAADMLQAAAGATGNVTTTLSANNNRRVGRLIALNPATNKVAEWRMDEASWNGTAGEVVDNTGNGNDGTALNGAQTASTTPAKAGDPGTCGYGTFPLNTSATPVVAVDSGLDVNDDIGNTGTITLWYNSNTVWNGGGDRQLLDAPDPAAPGGPKYFFLTLLNSGQLRFGYEDSADGDFRINSPVQAFAANTWVHIAVTWDLPNDSQAIYINGTQVITGAGNTNGTLGELTNLFIGDNDGNYIIPGDTTANSANGSIDEVRVYNSTLDSSAITTIMNETHDCFANIPEMEVAEITLNDTSVTSAFTSITFKQTYTTAPLVFILPSNEGGADPASIRIQNVTTTSFQISLYPVSTMWTN
mgnify:CR=1 FL=1